MKAQSQKPNVVFFSRSYQCKLFSLINSEAFNSIHVTLTKSEKKYLEIHGFIIKYCFEEYINSNFFQDVSNYLDTSFYADRFLNKLSLTERNTFLQKEIAFWSEIFDEYKPITIINEQVAIEISEVMYIEARKRNIVYTAWMSNPINGYFYWIRNPMSLELDSRITEISPTQNSIDVAKSYLSNIRLKNERPYYLNPYLNTSKIRNLLGSINSYLKHRTKESFVRNNSIQYESYSDDTKLGVIRNINSFFYKYDDFEKMKNQEIILYPLHYEPEASLLYLSEFFTNQIALIENISKCLTSNQILVVKEHPAQRGMLLTKKYRDLKKTVSCIYYLPHSVISYDVIKISTLIITLTSHLGWEALILGKPVFIIGKMFYRSYPDINVFVSFEALREKIKNKDFIYPKEESLIRFIAQIYNCSHRGRPFFDKDLYTSENINDIRVAIEKEVNNLILQT